MRMKKHSDRSRRNLVEAIESITQNTRSREDVREAAIQLFRALRGGKRLAILRAVDNLAQTLQPARTAVR